ncbi:MAG: hypothetical protein ACFNLD_07585 [Kingella oralis]|uniref:hypothetical protein n=1 Tax=Kingella oralis TaxID=505 RepID=UPI0034E5569A
MNNDYLLRGFWRDMAMLAAGMTAGAMMTAAVSHAKPPVSQSAVMVEKNCDALWNTPYADLNAAEQEARYQCDEAEALVDRWAAASEEGEP